MPKKDLNKLSQTQKPKQSFEQMVSEATLSKLKPYIQQEVIRVSNLKAQEHANNLRGLYERVTTIEKLLIEKLGITDEEYVDKVTDVQDDSYGVKKLKRPAKPGDILRVEVSTKSKDQTEFQGTTRMMLQDVGSGASIGKELEAELIGLSENETKEIEFGKDKSLVAKITVNRVSGKEE